MSATTRGRPSGATGGGQPQRRDDVAGRSRRPRRPAVVSVAPSARTNSYFLPPTWISRSATATLPALSVALTRIVNVPPVA